MELKQECQTNKVEKTPMGKGYFFWVKPGNGDAIIKNQKLPERAVYALKKPTWKHWWVMILSRKIEPLYDDYTLIEITEDLDWINRNKGFHSS